MSSQMWFNTRIRSTPYSSRIEALGVQAYSVYNHMLLPLAYRSVTEDYWHLREHVQLWDVAAQRQVELRGPDAGRLDADDDAPRHLVGDGRPVSVHPARRSCRWCRQRPGRAQDRRRPLLDLHRRLRRRRCGPTASPPASTSTWRCRNPTSRHSPCRARRPRNWWRGCSVRARSGHFVLPVRDARTSTVTRCGSLARVGASRAASRSTSTTRRSAANSGMRCGTPAPT